MFRSWVVPASVTLAVLVAPHTAHAGPGPTRKVTIETDPPGAHVYLNQKEDGVVCEATPCTIDVPIGETTLIIEAENYEPSITMLDVAKGRGTLKQTVVKLSAAAGGGIDAKAIPTAKGATVKIDDQDKGMAPVHVPIEVGPHHVAYYVDGKQVYEEYIDVQAGPEFYELAPKLTDGPPGPPPHDDGNPLDPDKPAVHATGPERPHTRIVTLAMVFDVGFRQYAYDNPQTPNLRTESEGGQFLAGPLVEIYPTALFAPGKLPGLALVGRFEFGFHDNTVTGNGIQNPTTTFWQSMEVSVRHRWVIGDAGTVDASAGYVRDRYEFNGMDNDIALVPDADYQSIRFGARGSLLLGDLEPYLVLENRAVVSSGSIAARFDHASTNGLHTALGIGYRHGAISARVEGQLTRYGSTFSNDGTMPKFQADGGTDTIELISLSAGYTY